MSVASMADRILNINVGVLGHVDSGKTSLVRALSTELSTAALDKNPQSQERGITLDLGFSAFLSEIPEHLSPHGFGKLQFTLVDCPGHASLIRTIIGGAQIIDMMILVIDIVKGIQTQTAECLVIGEITTDNMIVVLNKVDMLPEEGRDKAVERVFAKIQKVLASTKFARAPIIALSASPGGTGKLGAAAPVDMGLDGSKSQSDTVAGLVALLKSKVTLPCRSPDGPFLFAIDHCFPIKGQGTVMTGTVLAGTLRVNDNVELPSLRQERKVKSMQMFRKPVQRITQGDRAGICVTNLDASLVERGLAATPGSVPTMHAALALVKRIRFFKGVIPSESKVHITIGHATVMATVIFFGARELAARRAENLEASLELRRSADADSVAAAIVDDFSGAVGDTPTHVSASPAVAIAGGAKGSAASAAAQHGLEAAVLRSSTARGIPPLSYDWSSDPGGAGPARAEWEWQEELLGGRAGAAQTGAKDATPTGTGTNPSPPADDLVVEWQWAALLLDSPVQTPVGSMLIGSKLDADITANACRLAFFGRLAEPLPSADVHELRRLNLYKRKLREGVVDRIESKSEGDPNGPITLLGRGLFKKETDMHSFTGLTVHTKAGQVGTIEGAFGKSGKFRVTFPRPGMIDLVAAALGAGKNPTECRLPSRQGAVPCVQVTPVPPIRPGEPLLLRFRKYQYEPKSSEDTKGKTANRKIKQ